MSEKEPSILQCPFPSIDDDFRVLEQRDTGFKGNEKLFVKMFC